MPSFPGLESEVFFGDTETALPDWRSELPDDDDSDDATPEERAAVIGMLGFDPSEQDETENDDSDAPAALSAERAPSGYTALKPLHIGGHDYVGGQWIPAKVMAQASQDEKAKLNPAHADRESKYTAHAMKNLKKTSRPAAGSGVDTSASAGKAAKMTEWLTGEKAAALANANFERVIRDLHGIHPDQLDSPDAVSALADRVNQTINKGITKAGVLLRTDDSTKFPYTAARNLPLARKQFSEELHAKLQDDTADPIETAAWVEWRLNLTDHAYADGCGKTAKAMAAMVLMHAGVPLPTYGDDPKEFYGFSKAPHDPHRGGESYKGDDYKRFVRFYKTKVPTHAAGVIKKLEKEKFPPVNAEGLDSHDRHQNGGAFSQQRQALHDKVVGTIRHGIPAASGKPGDEKTFTLMGGGPGSGKSHIKKSGVVKLHENTVDIDSDGIKDQLPEYHALLKDGYVGNDNGRGTGHFGAASYVHEESSHLAKIAQSQSLAAGQHVALDGTGDNSVESVMKKVGEARRAGYKVNAEYVTCSTETALQRAQKRALEKGRNVPVEMLRSVHKGVSQVLPELLKQGAFDNCRLWDTDSGGAPVMVASAQGNKLTVHHPEKWAAFLANGQEHAGMRKFEEAGKKIEALKERVGEFTRKHLSEGEPAKSSLPAVPPVTPTAPAARVAPAAAPAAPAAPASSYVQAGMRKFEEARKKLENMRKKVGGFTRKHLG